ncbi:helix-turn-helix domain-containing protein [Hymenobacter monticola]|uniref:Helix-turn-helix domain-containing protein n=2 Tax=Hymenobacter monticola TaxID=1705399 RepID=A0ABY4B532_9BACT|nr:helix-turn-helix transcriptional regulator [Hymenobacter monticola]UOE32821.1 helix-turn-helix domain-containing protein [Hymenobacter monticola]
MIERIRTLLETRQLTPTQFADAIGVARPIVSHILSGRNKPSLEVVQRILAAMPDLSMPWLLNGTGPMQASAAPAMPPAHSVVKEAPVLTAAPQPKPSVGNENQTGSPGPTKAVVASSPKPTPRRFTGQVNKFTGVSASVAPGSALWDTLSVASTAPDVAVPPAAPSPAAPSEEMAVEPNAVSPAPALVQEQPVSPEHAPTAANPTAAALFAGAEKPIRRIVIFYRDGSFADYQPE